MTASRDEAQRPFRLAGVDVAPGTTRRLDLPVARLPTHTQLDVPVTVVHGARPGPTLWLSAALHGDEVNGVEVIRRVLLRIANRRVAGTLLAVPIVNVFGFIGQSRYLPDRRDLNRCFPGSAKGSLGSRIAHLFVEEIVARCTHGIDLHTASNERENLPHVRGNLEDPETLRCARAFGAAVMAQAKTLPGTLRATSTKRGVTTLLFEAGECRRFNEEAIEVGARGVLGVMAELGMIPRRGITPAPPSLHILKSSWVRARRAGLLRLDVALGDRLARAQRIGIVADPFGDEPIEIRAPFDGIVIGRTLNPVIHRGDAVVHLGALP